MPVKLVYIIIFIQHNFNIYSLDLLLYRPIKKDLCERCEYFKANILYQTEEDKNNHIVHTRLGDYMKNRMSEAERTCVGPLCVARREKGTKKKRRPNHKSPMTMHKVT